METPYLSSVRSRDLIAFFVFAFAFSWLIGIPLALANQGIIPAILPAWAHYLFAYGPMLSALMITWLSEGRSGLRGIGLRMIKWKVHRIWWIVAFSPLVLGFIVALILNLIAGSEIHLSTFGQVRFLSPMGMAALLLWILTFGIGEETGWRGFALPRLQDGRSAFHATVILWFFWALWHLPAFFYLYDPSIAIGWIIGQFAGAIVFSWLFNSASGSILIVTIWHGCFNFVTSTDAGNGMLAALVSTIVMVWALAIVVIFKPANLSRAAKVVK